MFIFLFAAYLGGNIYICIKGLQMLTGFSLGIRITAGVIYWILALSFMTAMFFRGSQLPEGFAQTLHTIGNGWLVFTLYMVLFLLAFDLLKWIYQPFVWSFPVAALLTVALLGYGYYKYQFPNRKEMNLSIAKPIDGTSKTIKIVAISDVHLGHGTTKKQLQRYVDMINAEQPDVILIGGDLIDNSIEPLYSEKMNEELSQLKASMGIYMAAGNHEGFSRLGEAAKFLKLTPIQLLQDSVVTLPNGVQIVGRKDRRDDRRLSLDDLIKKTDSNKPIIVVDHQPYDLEKTEAAGVDLQFSGHTHRGQVFPFSLIIDQMFEQSYGYRLWGKSHVYVSSGLSLWGPPFRIGTDSEMVVFNLTFE